MQLGPLLDKLGGTTREPAVQHLTGGNDDLRLLLSVLRMEVGWRMVVEVHRDHDPVERGDSGHRSNVLMGSDNDQKAPGNARGADRTLVSHRPTLDIDTAAANEAHETLVALGAPGDSDHRRIVEGVKLEIIEVLDPGPDASELDDKNRPFVTAHWAAARLIQVHTDESPATPDDVRGLGARSQPFSVSLRGSSEGSQ